MDKLVLTDMLLGNQLNESHSSLGLVHPWSLDLIKTQLAAPNLSRNIVNKKLSKPVEYEASLDQETGRLARLYQGLVKDRYLDLSK